MKEVIKKCEEKMTDKYVAKIDKSVENKSKEIMTV